MTTLEYTALNERAQKAIGGSIPPEKRIDERTAHFASVKPREPDKDGDTEALDGVTFTHHFVEAPGDYEKIRWHYVEAGKPGSEIILFLHGIPDSWFQWHHQMSALSSTHHCVAVDLKGYGQSEKGPGDYRHDGTPAERERLRSVGQPALS